MKSIWLQVVSVTLLSAITGLLAGSCNPNRSQFYTDRNELIKILDDPDQKQDFIRKWELEACEKGVLSQKFCFQDSVLILEFVQGDGYTLTLNGLVFPNAENIFGELKAVYGGVDLKSLESYDKHLGSYDLIYGGYFVNDEHEIIFSKFGKSTNNIFVITVNHN